VADDAIPYGSNIEGRDSWHLGTSPSSIVSGCRSATGGACEPTGWAIRSARPLPAPSVVRRSGCALPVPAVLVRRAAFARPVDGRLPRSVQGLRRGDDPTCRAILATCIAAVLAAHWLGARCGPAGRLRALVPPAAGCRRRVHVWWLSRELAGSGPAEPVGAALLATARSRVPAAARGYEIAMSSSREVFRLSADPYSLGLPAAAAALAGAAATGWCGESRHLARWTLRTATALALLLLLRAVVSAVAVSEAAASSHRATGPRPATPLRDPGLTSFACVALPFREPRVRRRATTRPRSAAACPPSARVLRA